MRMPALVLIWSLVSLAFGAIPAAAESSLADAARKCNEGQPQDSVVGCTTLIKGKLLDRIDLATAYMNRAIAYAQLAKPQASKRDLSSAIELTPDNALLYYNRGNISFDEQKFADAISDYDAAIATESMFALAYLNRGLAYTQLGDLEKSKRDLRKALALDPNLAVARELIAELDGHAEQSKK